MLTKIAVVLRITHTPRHGVFNTTPPVSRAVARTIFYTAILCNKWWPALALPEAIAHTIFDAFVDMRAWYFPLVRQVFVAIKVGVGGVAAMFTVLFVGEWVVVAEISGAGYIAAVHAVVSIVAKTVAILAGPVHGAIRRTGIDIVLPHVLSRRCGICDAFLHGDFLVVPVPAVNHHYLVLFRIDCGVSSPL